MFDRTVGVSLAGLLGGVIFYLHAIQSGGVYPFLWPVVAGAAAVRLAEHRRPGESAGGRTIIGLLTGCTVAITFVALGLTASGFIGSASTTGEFVPRAPGEPLNTLVVSLVFIPSAALGALLMRNPQPVRGNDSSPSRPAG